MFAKFRQSMLMLCLSFTVVTSSGCFALLLGGAAGAAGVVYIQGILEKNFDRGLKDTHTATLKALKAEDIFVKTDELNVANSEIKGEFDDGEKIQINIDALTEKSSKVKIRVGVFGDELKSNMIMSAIEKRL